MAWFVVMQLFSTLLQALWLGRTTDQTKDLEILLLRRQVAILGRQGTKPQHLSRVDKLMLAVLTTRLKAISGWSASQLNDVIRIVQPATVLRWHGEKVAPQVDVSA